MKIVLLGLVRPDCLAGISPIDAGRLKMQREVVAAEETLESM